MKKVPRRTKPLAKALVEIAHRHIDDDGQMSSEKKFEEVAIICETRPSEVNLKGLGFPKCGIVISCGSIGWFNSLNESHTGKIIFLNSVNYLIEISNNLKKGDLMTKKEDVGGYSDVHNWAMRHGASNNDGRISKGFFPTDKKSRKMADELRPWKLNKVDNGTSIARKGL